MMWGTANMGWTWGFGLLAVAGVALIIYVVVRALSNNTTGKAGPPSTPSPPAPTRARLILDERFARGELTQEQYKDQLRTLDEG
ncbi:SHOCT domain-containing protein [Cryobacterium psychrophilum]|uniref:SHOCT domain-containing protein n=1 Tax=Cryobacterium psychrophilum TaxID=41988 RepID=A0A4Y8KSQ9_9MICO|nr:SHOCT domain-containing protein [Cryobacterium psychrophilum]TDW29755.1 putative membrane protein [Cryobacterium psychrophilum]TFD81857.1 SHOCT domain-containing protein [Cryobacterium psychrophilum]